jgi:hypothetical protein
MLLAVKMFSINKAAIILQVHNYDTRKHRQSSLVFFSTFEPICLKPDSIMQRKGVPYSSYGLCMS